MNLELTGKRAIVTGATRGIGLAVARELANEGVDVAFCARDAHAVEATAGELSAFGVKAYGSARDVADGDAYRIWITEAAAALGGLDILVPNVSAGTTADDEQSWRASFEVDLMGAVRACDAALPQLRKSSAASVILIASVSAIEATPAADTRAYAALKAALIGYGAQLAQALAPEGIRVNSVSPGPIDFEGGFWDAIREAEPDVYRETGASVPLRRFGSPCDVANAVAFLASDRAAFITGANLRIDGGLVQAVDY
jgi:3-oxoacyl-[acyl-carrier protein] reductase